MKSKFSILLSCLLLLTTTLFAQSFSLFKWNSFGINYTALVIKNSDADMTTRVSTNFDGIPVIIEYKSAIEVKPSYAPKDYVFAPKSTPILIKASGMNLKGYSPDNFILTDYDATTRKGAKYIVLDKKSINDISARSEAPTATVKHYKNISELKSANIKLEDFVLTTEPLYAKLNNISASPIIPSAQVSGKVNVHVILVGDVIDNNIGQAVATDIRNVENVFLNHLKKDNRLNIKVTKILGNDLTNVNITNSINSLPNDLSNDVVFFFYSGHGYNLESKPSIFPMMHLKSSSTYNLEQIKNLVAKKNPRLNIVIGDLCNSVIRNSKSVENITIDVSRGFSTLDAEKVEKLFIKAKGSMVSTSSAYGEYSYCLGVSTGSAFTAPFTQIFKNAFYQGNNVTADWKSIFRASYDDAKIKTSHLTNKTGNKGQSGFSIGSINY